MYAILFGGVAAAWLAPPEWVLSLPVAARLVVAVALAFVPIMAANVIFAKRFDTAVHPTTAFGANLLGAMLGGCLEYLALAVGYRALLLVCAALYLGAYASTGVSATRARGGSGRPAASAATLRRPNAAR
jgi:hypothetical protein